MGLLLSALTPVGGQVKLTTVRTVPLEKLRGSVAELVVDELGQFIVRSFNLDDLEYQAVEIYRQDGSLKQVIGGQKGWGPGSFYRLMGLDLGPNGQIYALDLNGRISVFEGTGKLLRSILIQQPPIRPKTLALDRAHGKYYVGGCLAKNEPNNGDCTYLHTFGLADDRLYGSSIDTDAGLVETRLKLLMTPRIAVDEKRGQVLLMQGPSPTLHFMSTDMKSSRSMQVASGVAATKMLKSISIEDARNATVLDRMFYDVTLFESLHVAGDFLLIGLRSGRRHFGQIIDLRSMKQIATDIALPGVPVGVDKAGHYIFASTPQTASTTAKRLWTLIIGGFGL